MVLGSLAIPAFAVAFALFVVVLEWSMWAAAAAAWLAAVLAVSLPAAAFLRWRRRVAAEKCTGSATARQSVTDGEAASRSAPEATPRVFDEDDEEGMAVTASLRGELPLAAFRDASAAVASVYVPRARGGASESARAPLVRGLGEQEAEDEGDECDADWVPLSASLAPVAARSEDGMHGLATASRVRADGAGVGGCAELTASAPG